MVDLTARNLAMSTAMVLHHGRVGDLEQQGRSERVQVRALELLRQLEPQLVKERLEQLLAGTRGEGGIGPFSIAGAMTMSSARRSPRRRCGWLNEAVPGPGRP